MGRLIGSVGLAPGSDSGFDLDTKGQIHGYTSTQYALDVGTNNQVLTADSTTASGLDWKDSSTVTPTTSFVIACSDEDTAIDSTGTKVTFRMPYAFTVTSVRASLTTAGTGANLFTVDISEAASSILSTKITIDATETTSTTATTPPVISDSALADDSQITIDVDQLDSGGVAAGLKVYIIGYRVV